MTGPKRVNPASNQVRSAKTTPFQGLVITPDQIRQASLPPGGPFVIDGDRLDYIAPYGFHPYQYHHKGGRSYQEDSPFAFHHSAGHLSIYGVADGIGGHIGGRAASQTVKTNLRDYSIWCANGFDMKNLKRIAGNRDPNLPLHEWINNQPALLDKAITELVKMIVGFVLPNAIRNKMESLQREYQSNGDSSKAAKIKSMGTTLTACFEIGRRAYIAHVGDSRAYLLRNGVVKLITNDHSWAWLFMVERGLPYDEALDQARSKIKSLHEETIEKLRNEEGETAAREYIEKKAKGLLQSGLRRAVTTNKQDEDYIDVYVEPLEENDRIILVTDGLLQALADDYYGRIMEGPIAQLFQASFTGSPAKMIIHRALEKFKERNQGRLTEDLDNLSVVVREPR